MKKLNARGISHLLAPLLIVIGVAAAGTYMLIASHAAQPCVSRNIGPGNSGGCTQAIQRMMLLNPDGVYGSSTKKEIKDFQSAASLKPDGVMGKRTWYFICRNTKANIHNLNMPLENRKIFKKGFVQASCSVIL